MSLMALTSVDNFMPSATKLGTNSWFLQLRTYQLILWDGPATESMHMPISHMPTGPSMQKCWFIGMDSTQHNPTLLQYSKQVQLATLSAVYTFQVARSKHSFSTLKI